MVAIGDGADRQLGPVRRAEFADHDQIQRRLELLGDFESDRNAATGQGEDYDLRASKSGECFRQLPACVLPVAKYGALPKGSGSGPIAPSLVAMKDPHGPAFVKIAVLQSQSDGQPTV
jgi:hypothetical protein